MDLPGLNKLVAELASDVSLDVISTACLLASSAKESRCWLNALPVTTPCSLLHEFTFPTAVRLGLGAKICQPHTCICGAPVRSFALHGLGCLESAK